MNRRIKTREDKTGLQEKKDRSRLGEAVLDGSILNRKQNTAGGLHPFRNTRIMNPFKNSNVLSPFGSNTRVHAKFRVSEPGDSAEVEADRIADQVMNMDRALEVIHTSEISENDMIINRKKGENSFSPGYYQVIVSELWFNRDRDYPIRNKEYNPRTRQSTDGSKSFLLLKDEFINVISECQDNKNWVIAEYKFRDKDKNEDEIVKGFVYKKYLKFGYMDLSGNKYDTTVVNRDLHNKLNSLPYNYLHAFSKKLDFLPISAHNYIQEKAKDWGRENVEYFYNSYIDRLDAEKKKKLESELDKFTSGKSFNFEAGYTHQYKLKEDDSSSELEKEADKIADEVLNISMASQTGYHGNENYNNDSVVEDIKAKGNSGRSEIDYAIESEIDNLGNGKPLSESERIFFEHRFGADFSDVRIYDNENANKLASDLNARAFTKGNDIVFGKNEYSPDSAEGKWLMGHELAHVIQNRLSNLIFHKSIDLKEKSYKESKVFELINKGYVYSGYTINGRTVFIKYSDEEWSWLKLINREWPYKNICFIEDEYGDTEYTINENGEIERSRSGDWNDKVEHWGKIVSGCKDLINGAIEIYDAIIIVGKTYRKLSPAADQLYLRVLELYLIAGQIKDTALLFKQIVFLMGQANLNPLDLINVNREIESNMQKIQEIKNRMDKRSDKIKAIDSIK